MRDFTQFLFHIVTLILTVHQSGNLTFKNPLKMSKIDTKYLDNIVTGLHIDLWIEVIANRLRVIQSVS